MFYIFDCGCKIAEPTYNRKRQRVVCPDHPESNLINRQTECEDCGVLMLQSSNHRIKKRCKACQLKLDNRKRREYNQRNRKKKNKGVLYVFDCGCKLTRDQTTKDKKTQRMTCPNHIGSIPIRREGKCKECGESIKMGIWGHVTIRCPECKKKHTREYFRKNKSQLLKAQREKRKNLKIQGYEAYSPVPPRKPDCKHYNDCLDINHGRLMKNPRACINCPDYDPDVDLDIMDYMQADGERMAFDYANI